MDGCIHPDEADNRLHGIDNLPADGADSHPREAGNPLVDDVDIHLRVTGSHLDEAGNPHVADSHLPDCLNVDDSHPDGADILLDVAGNHCAADSHHGSDSHPDGVGSHYYMAGDPVRLSHFEGWIRILPDGNHHLVCCCCLHQR